MRLYMFIIHGINGDSKSYNNIYVESYSDERVTWIWSYLDVPISVYGSLGSRTSEHIFSSENQYTAHTVAPNR